MLAKKYMGHYTNFISRFKRKVYFIYFSTVPFRFSTVAYHTKERFLSLLGVRHGFRIIDLAVTYDCNLKCEHCSALVMKNHLKRNLGLDDYREIVRQARQLHTLSWNVTGGEPLLVPWLEDLIPILNPKIHYISIQTNCMLLDRKRAQILARLGVNCITTSLDSAEPVQHNNFRGSEYSYQRVMEGVKAARDAGMQVLIGGTVTHENLRSPGLIQLIEKVNRLGAIFLFNLAVPCGNWAGNERIILHGEDRNYLLQLMKKYPKTTTDHEAGRNAIGCPAGVEKIYITPYGDVIPCPFIHISFGSILNDSLQKIISRMRKVEHFRSYQDICVAAEDINFQKKVMGSINSFAQSCPVPYTKIYGELHE